tara:strand:- start:6557 stop:7048 length:492 start_codon:yes stop_codon:yes gene_type:complete
MSKTAKISTGVLDTLPDGLTKILPYGYKVYSFFQDTDKTYAIYISKKQLDIKDMQRNSIGFVAFALYPSESKLRITWVESNKKGVGIGHYLMILTAYLGTFPKIKKIELDDDSDFAHKGSLYQKVGCTYINEEPYPDVECNIKDVLNKYEEFITKYKGKGFFV